MIAARISALFDFEQPRARQDALLLLLAVTVISWDIGMPGPLPAVRLEQILLAFFLPSLALFHVRHREYLRPHFVDLAFLAIAATTVLSIVVAPLLVSQVTWSLRDPFELARIVEYWVLFRLGLTLLPTEATIRSIIRLLLIVVLANTLFSLVQYLHPGDFNDIVTSIWTVPNNLQGVELTGRVVGTAGNANYYGIFSGFFLALALALILLRANIGPSWRWLTVAAASAGCLSVVMAQSRTAVFAILGAFFLALVLVAFRRRTSAAYAPVFGIFLIATTLSIAFVEVVPPRFESFHERFSPTGLSSEASLTTRVTRWKSFFSDFFADAPSFCDGKPLHEATPNISHIPVGETGAPVAPAEALARDEQRKDDVVAISEAAVDYYCAENTWPTQEGIEPELEPEFLDTWPLDPLSGNPYLVYSTPQGFTIGAQLENPADPDGPIFGLGTIPSMIVNPSFDHGDPAGWQTTYDTTVTTAAESRLFGSHSAAVTFSSPPDGPPGGIFQRVIFEFPLDTDYTVGTWARTATGVDQKLLVYLSARTANGAFIEDYEEASQEFTIPASGEWVRFEVPFTTSATERINELHVAYYSPTGDGAAVTYLDGVTISQGTFVPHFRLMGEIDPASLQPIDLPTFADSPLVGTGPGNSLAARRGLDNEYLLFLDRFGILGALAYLSLFGGAFAVGWRAWRASPEGLVAALALAFMTFTLALAAFNVAAGSFYHFQIMAVYWMLAGVLAAASYAARASPAQPPQSDRNYKGFTQSESASPPPRVDGIRR